MLSDWLCDPQQKEYKLRVIDSEDMEVAQMKEDLDIRDWQLRVDVVNFDHRQARAVHASP